MASMHELIRERRRELALNEETVASKLGISLAAYRDLESYPDEAVMALTVGELARLLSALKWKPDSLFGSERGASVTASELQGRISERVEELGGVAEFEDKAGWRIDDILQDENALEEWSVDQLRDVAKELRVSWTSALANIQHLLFDEN